MRIVAAMFSTVIAFGAAASPALGQAYCALRDPTRHIYQAFPDATSYKSIVHTVDEGVRRQVAAELPFTLHFNELGRHTVYLPVRGGRPLGLIHARSERGRWGLLEIVWSFSPTMQVTDYSFQRCRARNRAVIESEEFKSQLVGKRFEELRELLAADGASLESSAIRVPAGTEEMALTLIRSALKTIAVTRLAWADDLRVIRPLHHVYRAFPNAARADVVANPYRSSVREEIERHLRVRESTIERSSATVIRVTDADGRLLGHVVRTPWSSLDQRSVLCWTIRNGSAIQDVVAENGWPNGEIRQAFQALHGLDIADIGDCSTAVEIVGAEVLLMSRAND